MKKLLLSILGLGAVFYAGAQDLHFTRIHEMQSWYNQSIQMSRYASGALNYRTLDYQGIIAFRTATLIADVPLLKAAARKGNNGFATVSGGVSVDKSNSQVLRNMVAMTGIAYSVPVNATQNTYVSAGFQGSIFQNSIDLSRASLPDQYDKISLAPVRATTDPYQSSEVHYLSLNTGISVFHQSLANSWYAGASVRHINEPESSNSSGSSYHLPRTLGVQAGYTHKLDEDQRLAFYTALNWNSKAYEHLANLQYNYEFNRYGHDRGLGMGLGYRYGDAVVPNFEFRLEQTSFGFNYDINVGNKGAGMRRRSLELGIKHRFK